jgi:UDP-N-acetylglucosamine 2-epimerase (non-hydrolysing)
MPEVIKQHRAGIDNSTVLEELGLKQHEYILLSAHREENIDNEENFMGLMSAINETAETYGMPIIYSMHPRSQGFIEKRGFKFDPLVRPLKPFGFFDYCRLQIGAFCVLSDSGTLAEESAILGFPAVSIRTSTERPEAIDKGTMILGGVEKESMIRAIELCVRMHKNKDFGSLSESYMDENVSVKVVKIIQSYTGIINKFVWRK